MKLDLQVDLLDLGAVHLVGLGALVENVDVPVDVPLAVEVLLQPLDAHLHLGVEGVLLGHVLRWLLLLAGTVALPEHEAGGQQHKDQQGDGGHAAPDGAAHLRVQGGRGLHVQPERLHVGAVLHLVALVVVDEGLVQCEVARPVHQVPAAALQLIRQRALDPWAGAGLRSNHVDDLEVPLVSCLHLQNHKLWLSPSTTSTNDY